MTEAEVRVLEQLAAAATPGPWAVAEELAWIVDAPSVKSVVNCGNIPNGELAEHANAAFVAASRSAVPALCAALREAWLDLGRFAQDSEAHQLGVRAGLGLAAEMVRQRQKEWEGRGSAHMQAKGRALAHFAEELERKTKQPAPPAARPAAAAARPAGGGAAGGRAVRRPLRGRAGHRRGDGERLRDGARSTGGEMTSPTPEELGRALLDDLAFLEELSRPEGCYEPASRIAHRTAIRRALFAESEVVRLKTALQEVLRLSSDPGGTAQMLDVIERVAREALEGS